MADSSATDTPSANPIPGALALVPGGVILHQGNYCHFMQQAAPGDNTLPVANGCQFYMTTPADLFATDGSHYSVSEAVGDAQLGVQGPPNAKAMIVCRISPRGQYWFWISADGHWNIDSVSDVHNPQDLVSAQDAEPMRQYIKAGALNHVQFKCAGGQTSREITLAMNVNGHQFTALTVPMPVPATPLASPNTPWFVDIGARLITSGTLQATVAKVTLYDHE